jgi:hypothetical protein
MKVNELFEASRISLGGTNVKIMKALKGLKGVKIYEPMAAEDDDSSEEWIVRVVYKAKRGQPGYERIHVYQTKDGDWGFSSQTENKERGTLEDLLDELRDYLTHSAKFHARGSAIEEGALTEGYERKVLAVLKDAGVDAYFEKGTLMLQTKDDWKKATKVLKAADKILELPSMEYLSAGI